MKKETKIQIIVIVVLAIILGVLLYVILSNNGSTQTNFKNKEGIQNFNSNQTNTSQNQTNQATTNASGNVTVEEEKTLTGNYETSTSDESVIKVTNGGNLTLDNATITKSGDSTNTENSEFYGVNAAVLTTSNSTTTISNTNITTSAKGANAVFATGTDAKVYIKDTTIISTGNSSARGLDSTYGGYIEADNVTIVTNGGSCATLATDRGEGTVIARNSNLTTNGAGSPIIYSTGEITVENTEGVANGAQLVVVEGKNTATVKNSSLKSTGVGNRGTTDKCGIMIYQSMSGDASTGTGTLNATNSTLEILSTSNVYNTAPFFFITNTDAVINLEGNTIKYGSGILLKAEGTSEWGKTNSNGGNVILNATKQKLEGHIEIDSISTLTLNLKDSSSLNGSINTANTAKNIILNIDKTSTLKLTETTYVTALNDEDESYSNIDFNEYKLYVNGSAIN